MSDQARMIPVAMWGVPSWCRCETRWFVDIGEGFRMATASHAAMASGCGLPVKLGNWDPMAAAPDAEFRTRYTVNGVRVDTCPACDLPLQPEEIQKVSSY